MNIRSMGRPAQILLVEDSPQDVQLIENALTGTVVRSTLYVARDGVEALDFLYREGGYANAPRPDLILLDLNLPRKDGREVLAVIKADEELKRIPLIVFTVSNSEEDIIKAYDLHANCYITKPVDPDSFIAHVRSIQDFWSSWVELPPNRRRNGRRKP
ncbi:MAG: response regulator [Chloroflexi bacterium]|nr:MAG: response regulator [Chloroflexota bacterium]